MSGWQGVKTQPRGDVSEWFVAKAALLRALRTYLAHGTTGNRERLEAALEQYARREGPMPAEEKPAATG